MPHNSYIEQLDNVLKAADAPVLSGSGRKSHKQAMTKAEKEYRTYQEKTLSPVEVAYLESIKEIEKTASKNLKAGH